MALFGQENEDLLKVLTKVQAATALAQGAQGLQGFTKSIGIASQALRAFAVSNPFTAVFAAIVALSAAVAILVKNWQDANSESAKLSRQLEAQKKINEELNRVLDNEIKILEAQGDREFEILQLKQRKAELSVQEAKTSVLLQEQILKEAVANDTLWESLLRLTGTAAAADLIKIKRIKEQTEELKNAKKALEDAQAELQVAEINITTFQRKEREKRAEEKKKENDDLFAAAQKEADRLEAVDIARRDRKRQEEKKLQEQLLKDQEDFIEETLEKWEEQADMEKRADDQRNNLRISAAKTTFDTIGSLVETFAGQSEAAQRRAFNVQKAASIASTIIETFAAAQGAYRSQLTIPTPDAPIRAAVAAGIAVAQGLARVAAIARTQFQASGGGGISAPSPGGGGVSAPAPSLTSPVTQLQQTAEGEFAGFGQTQQQPLRAFVVETDVTQVQNRVETLEQRATF